MGNNLPALNLGAGMTAIHMGLMSNSTCALLNDANVNCWGDNSFGQTASGTSIDIWSPGVVVSLGTGKTVSSIGAGGSHACAILNDGSLKCWGRNQLGQLGLGNTINRGNDFGLDMGDNLPIVDLGTGRTASVIAGGGDHTCAILDDSTVKCWGSNASGNLGVGDTSHRGDQAGEMGDALPAIDFGTGKTATAIAAGGNHTCARLNDGSVKCWGNNTYGQLGLGDTSARGDATGEMGDALPAVNLGTGKTAVSIAAGDNYTCAVLNDGSLKCWGDNAFGQLGLGDTNPRGDSANEMGDNLPAVNVGTGRTATTVQNGRSHTCAILDDGKVKCWGKSDLGQLGLGDTVNRGDGPGEMGDNLPYVSLF